MRCSEPSCTHPADACELLPKAGICTLAELTALSCLPFPQHYWPRLLITCGGWVANDFAFYGVRGRCRALLKRVAHLPGISPHTCVLCCGCGRLDRRHAFRVCDSGHAKQWQLLCCCST